MQVTDPRIQVCSSRLNTGLYGYEQVKLQEDHKKLDEAAAVAREPLQALVRVDCLVMVWPGS